MASGASSPSPRTSTRTRAPGRPERAWRRRAARSLPVPASPRISTAAPVGATRAIRSRTRLIGALSPISSRSSSSAGASPSPLRRRSAAAARTVSRKRGLFQGFITKSLAPAFMAATAILMPLCPVTTTTTASGSWARICASHSKPSAPEVAPWAKFRSSRIASMGWAVRTLQASAGLAAVKKRKPFRSSSTWAEVSTSGSSSTNRIRPDSLDRPSTMPGNEHLVQQRASATPSRQKY